MTWYCFGKKQVKRLITVATIGLSNKQATPTSLALRPHGKTETLDHDGPDGVDDHDHGLCWAGLQHQRPN